MRLLAPERVAVAGVEREQVAIARGDIERIAVAASERQRMQQDGEESATSGRRACQSFFSLPTVALVSAVSLELTPLRAGS